jgi:hypothetical protein
MENKKKMGISKVAEHNYSLTDIVGRYFMADGTWKDLMDKNVKNFKTDGIRKIGWNMDSY